VGGLRGGNSSSSGRGELKKRKAFRGRLRPCRVEITGVEVGTGGSWR